MRWPGLDFSAQSTRRFQPAPRPQQARRGLLARGPGRFAPRPENPVFGQLLSARRKTAKNGHKQTFNSTTASPPSAPSAAPAWPAPQRRSLLAWHPARCLAGHQGEGWSSKPGRGAWAYVFWRWGKRAAFMCMCPNLLAQPCCMPTCLQCSSREPSPARPARGAARSAASPTGPPQAAPRQSRRQPPPLCPLAPRRVCGRAPLPRPASTRPRAPGPAHPASPTPTRPRSTMPPNQLMAPAAEALSAPLVEAGDRLPARELPLPARAAATKHAVKPLQAPSPHADRPSASIFSCSDAWQEPAPPRAAPASNRFIAPAAQAVSCSPSPAASPSAPRAAAQLAGSWPAAETGPSSGLGQLGLRDAGQERAGDWVGPVPSVTSARPAA